MGGRLPLKGFEYRQGGGDCYVVRHQAVNRRLYRDRGDVQVDHFHARDTLRRAVVRLLARMESGVQPAGRAPGCEYRFTLPRGTRSSTGGGLL
jgi:hypothetical protein